MLRGQLLSSNITLNTFHELLHLLLCYLWPLLTFSPSADHQNSVLQNPRTSICKGKAHKLKPTSSNHPPSCLVPRLVYTLPFSFAFIRVHQRNHFWQYIQTHSCKYCWTSVMTSRSIFQTCSQSHVLKECQEALNVPPTPTVRSELLEEGEFLSFSNQHTPDCTALPDPSTPTAGPCPPNSSGIYSMEDHFANTIPILDYAHNVPALYHDLWTAGVDNWP